MEVALKQHELKQICDILKTAPTLKKAVLFGSRARGTARFNSDIDLLLYGISFPDRAKLSGLFEESTLPYHIDLVIHDRANTALNTEAEKYGKIIYEGVPICSK